MKLVIALLLTASLTANAWLLLETAPPPPARPAAAPPPATPVDSTLALAQRTADVLANTDGAEPAALRDHLRAAGADDATVRALVEARVRRRHQAETSAREIARLRGAWWRPAPSVPPSRLPPHPESLRELLGPDPLDLADAELRYQFLPAEKRRRLALLDLDYNELESRTFTTAPLQSEINEQQLLQRERAKDVLELLTPSERAEYELRFGGTAAGSARRFAAMNATEAEYRAIKPLIDILDRDRAKLLRREDYAREVTALEQRTLDALTASVGFDRTVDYLWASDGGPYSAVVRALREANRPPEHAAQLLQLAAEACHEAVALHRDPALTAEQKRAGLRALQAAYATRFESLVPADLQPKLPVQAVEWFHALGDGKYAAFRASVASSGWSIPTLRNITEPLRPHEHSGPIARRP